MMTAAEKDALIDSFNLESMALGTEDENILNYVGSLLELVDVMNRENFSVVFRPVEMSDGWQWVRAQEVRDET